MYYRLKDYPIKILSPNDVDIHLEIDENGKTAIENALLKATAYYKVLNMPVIAGDSGLYIDGLSIVAFIVDFIFSYIFDKKKR